MIDDLLNGRATMAPTSHYCHYYNSLLNPPQVGPVPLSVGHIAKWVKGRRTRLIALQLDHMLDWLRLDCIASLLLIVKRTHTNGMF